MTKTGTNKTTTTRRGRKSSTSNTSSRVSSSNRKELPDTKSILNIDKKVTTKFKYRKKVPKRIINSRNHKISLRLSDDENGTGDDNHVVKAEKGSFLDFGEDGDILGFLDEYTPEKESRDSTLPRKTTKLLTEIPPIITKPKSQTNSSTRKKKPTKITQKKGTTPKSFTNTKKRDKVPTKQGSITSKRTTSLNYNTSDDETVDIDDDDDDDDDGDDSLFGSSEKWGLNKRKEISTEDDVYDTSKHDSEGNNESVMDTSDTNLIKGNTQSRGTSRTIAKNTPYANKPKFKESKNCEKVGKTIKDLPSIIKNSVNVYAVEECENAKELLETISSEIASIRKHISASRIIDYRSNLEKILDTLTDDIDSIDETVLHSILDKNIAKFDSRSWFDKRIKSLETRVEHFNSLFEQLAQQYSLDRMRLHATIMPQLTGSIHYADRIIGIAKEDLKIFVGNRNPYRANDSTFIDQDSNDDEGDGDEGDGDGDGYGKVVGNSSGDNSRLYVDSQDLQKYRDCFNPKLPYPITNALQQHVLSSRTNKPHKKKKKRRKVRQSKQSQNTDIIKELPIKIFPCNLLTYPFG